MVTHQPPDERQSNGHHQHPAKTTKAATTKRPQAARTATGKGNRRQPRHGVARSRAGRAHRPAPAAKPKAPQPYIHKDRTRRGTGNRVQVLDLRGVDAPADAIAPGEAGGKPLNYATRRVTHDTHTHHATYAAAYRAAKTSADWCAQCTTADPVEKPAVE
ncbi:hypothetical protein [Actinomadura hibisca]|uniref:hypothetical protein n=1 Tax=Actinomadura hibisca TaxID=68565 RepID=UPI0008314ACF|nr:hypothetical protein [Actinomadura hibisca]